MYRPARLWLEPARIDTTTPNAARIWHYLLGGRDFYPKDQEAGDALASTYPQVRTLALAARYYQVRVVRELAHDIGIDQFLDIGSGMPAPDANTHEIAQKANPAARVAYTDIDPLAVCYGAALLRGRGKTICFAGDLHYPSEILLQASYCLDFRKPVAALFMGVLGHLESTGKAKEILAEFARDLPAGSYVAVWDAASTDPGLCQAQERYNRSGAAPYRLRTLNEFVTTVEPLDLVPPGVVTISEWRTELEDPESAIFPAYAAVGRTGGQ